jgi:hypothetical protein
VSAGPDVFLTRLFVYAGCLGSGQPEIQTSKFLDSSEMRTDHPKVAGYLV